MVDIQLMLQPCDKAVTGLTDHHTSPMVESMQVLPREPSILLTGSCMALPGLLLHQSIDGSKHVTHVSQ